MKINFSDRMLKPDFQDAFLAQIMKAAADPNTISFAGGLPNPTSFPVAEMKEAADKVMTEQGILALQYNGTQGYIPLRQYICDRYKKTAGLDFTPEDIVITNGSQQALDMLSATFVNPGDEIMVENPSYLAALQTFHLYDPTIIPVQLNEDGIDVEQLAQLVKEHNPKFFYVIPNFQNPTGLTYTEEIREKMAAIIKDTNIFVVEDNPYGELRFSGEAGHSFGYFLGEQCIHLGTFSKIVAPGMRIGWIACKNKEVMAKLVSYKGAMDLHTNIFSQVILTQFLADNDLDAHIYKTMLLYKEKAQFMMDCMAKYFPEGVTYTKPQGGMFLWVTLPEGIAAVDVQNEAIKQGVAVCAGDPFYEYDRRVRTMRINYSNSTNENMEKGIKILADVMRQFIK